MKRRKKGEDYMKGRNDERNKGRKKERKGAASERKELEEDKEV